MSPSSDVPSEKPSSSDSPSVKDVGPKSEKSGAIPPSVPTSLAVAAGIAALAVGLAIGSLSQTTVTSGVQSSANGASSGLQESGGSQAGGYTYNPETGGKAIDLELKKIKADIGAYYGKPIEIRVPVEIGDYYNFKYRGTEEENFSFRVKGDWEWIHAYGPKERFRDLFDYLAANGGSAVVNLTIVTDPSHDDNEIFTLLEWSK